MEPQTEMMNNTPEPMKLCEITLTTFNHEFEELSALSSLDAYNIGRTVETLKSIHALRCGGNPTNHRFVIDYRNFYIPHTLYSQTNI